MKSVNRPLNGIKMYKIGGKDGSVNHLVNHFVNKNRLIKKSFKGE